MLSNPFNPLTLTAGNLYTALIGAGGSGSSSGGTNGGNNGSNSQFAPKEWILEKIGIDPTKYETVTPEPTQALINENLKGMKGREWQNFQRIIRNYNNPVKRYRIWASLLQHGANFKAGQFVSRSSYCDA